MRDFTENQKKYLEFFRKNIGDWLKDPLMADKCVVISDNSLKGIYDTFGAAYDFAAHHFLDGDFIIQRIIDEDKIVSFLKLAV